MPKVTEVLSGRHDSSMAQWVKNLTVMQESTDTRVRSLGQEDSLQEEIGNAFQYSYLENAIGSRAWQATAKGHKEWDMTEHACTVNATSGVPELGFKLLCCFHFSPITDVSVSILE